MGRWPRSNLEKALSALATCLDRQVEVASATPACRAACEAGTAISAAMDAEGAKRRRTTEAAAEEEDPNSVSWCFSGSLMSNLVEQFDWAATPLGPLRSWPMAWKTSLSIMLSSHFPMVLWFGEQLTVLYNDAYLPLTGNKHPTALGQPGAQVWPEIWGTIGVMLGNVWRTGKPTWATDQLLLMDRHGYTEEVRTRQCRLLTSPSSSFRPTGHTVTRPSGRAAAA